LRLTGTIDAVSGATPTGVPAPPGSDQVNVTEIHTRRKAWGGDLSHQVKNVNVDVGFAESREPDYVSWGWSLNTLTDFNEKNTTLRAGLAGTYDRVEVFFEPAYLPKHTHDAIFGATQLLGPLTFVTLNVSWGRSTGYLAEPHKFVQKSIEIVANIFLPEDFGENSPDVRDRGSVFASVNRAFPGVKGAIEAGYRFYSDTFGLVAHTLEFKWLQHLGARFDLEPMVRLYEQGAAKFYYYNLDATTIIPVHVPALGAGPYYSSDFRLSSMDSYSYGLGAVWKASDHAQVDLAFEQYNMRGRDGVTPQSAYPRAAITTVGIKFLW
ncbi:MAG TPA: DUF3570 domain-containing protein, partial [Opitutaceae bacterium]|nr:DUF3570 domain-containing protein [Opitutaceae bacterium]